MKQGKKRKLAVDKSGGDDVVDVVGRKKVQVNPFLSTAEYDREEDSRPMPRSKYQKQFKQPSSKAFNPFLITPEYETEQAPNGIISNATKKRKTIDVVDKQSSKNEAFKPETDQGNQKSISTVHVDTDVSTEIPKIKNKSRCLNTFSRNLGKEREKSPKHKGTEDNLFGKKSFENVNSRKRNTRHYSVDDVQTRNWKNRSGKIADGLRNRRMKPKKLKAQPKVTEQAPVTPWGLSCSTDGNAQSLSLEAVGGFNWNATPQEFARISSTNNGVDDDDCEESDVEVVVERKKLTQAELRAKALEEEKTLKKKEKELLEAEENPQSPDLFERLLIGNPNSAELWIKYMGYHAVNADIEKARAVAQRAIKRIDPQMTSARLDVWIAFLNLDFTFSPPDVFKETFAEALRRNDDYAINSRVLNLYGESKNVSEVDQLANKMVRKYKDNLENWLQCQNALMMVGHPDKARYLLQKALAVLNKKQHVTLISRFALLENKYGFSSQADALFENLLTSYPQRVDLLSVYVDMLVKSSRTDLARSVLERASNNKLPVRKMKAVYTKWIAFEEAHGTPSDVTKVEEAAQQYVSGILKTSSLAEDETEGRTSNDTDHPEKYLSDDDLGEYGSDSSG